MGLLQFFSLVALALALSGSIKAFWNELRKNTGERKLALWQVFITAFWRSLFFLILSAILAAVFLYERMEDSRLMSLQSDRVLRALSATATLQFLADETEISRDRLLVILETLDAEGKITGRREIITLSNGVIIPVRLYRAY